MKFKTALRNNGWEVIEDFDPTVAISFDSKPVSAEKKEQCQKALIQRLAFLAAGTRLQAGRMHFGRT